MHGLPLFAGLHRWLRHSRRGSVALTIGLSLPIMIGMAALGTEITFLLLKQRQMQSSADVAALGGAMALQSGHPTPAIEARSITASLGFVNGAEGVTVTVNNPPASGPQAANIGAVEVIISQPQALSMVDLFYETAFNVAARAVAITGAGSYCVLQLDGSNGTGVTMANGAIANLTQCGLAANATGSSALSMSGAAMLNASSVSVAGSASITNGAAISPAGALKTSQPGVGDPYAAVVMPTFSGCGMGTSKSYGHGTWNLSPGVYCKGIAFTNDAIVTMASGLYIVDRGIFNVGGNVQLTGTNVTIFLTSSTGSGYATATISNGAVINLSAQTTGSMAGIVFFGDRRAPKANSNSMQGGATININGAIYLPTQKLIFQNGATNPSGCTQLITGTLQLVGGSKFQNNCPAGVSAIGGSEGALVE